MQDYQEFLRSKMQRPATSGFDVSPDVINPMLFPFQRDITIWALRLGKAAIFAECGLGKTGMQLEWAKHVVNHTGGKVLILAPLAVAHQTIKEGVKFSVDVVYAKSQDDIPESANIVITNYERLDKFEPELFSGIVLDESSILKSFTGKTKQEIIDTFEHTPYKLACTATPAPNDHMELGNHAEFLSIMKSDEMLTRWFVHDAFGIKDWRLKKHAEKDFWRWLTSWAVGISKPSDMGMQYDMQGYDLPELKIHEHFVRANEQAYARANENGMLFPMTNVSGTDIAKVRRESLNDRIAKAQQIISDLPENTPVILWVDYNYEQDAFKELYPEAVVVQGSDHIDVKSERLLGFANGDFNMLITKPSIAGFGLNYQHCHEMIFLGASFSFEKTYQALRRSWRFGQDHPVNAHIIYAETEGNVMKVLSEKRIAFEEMQQEMNAAMNEHGLFRDYSKLSLNTPKNTIETNDNWSLHLGDCVEVSQSIEDESIDFSIFSPPFSNMFMFSNHEADMGNVEDDDEFFEHYKYLIKELYRITTPGRLCAVHCVDIPTHKWQVGFNGLRDFSGMTVRAFQDEGWIYHTRITIWKNPASEMYRTKAQGLLHKSFKKDSTICRVGMPDYLLLFRKEGNDKPIAQNRVYGDYIGTEPPINNDDYSVRLWEKYASPVWFDINQTRTLNYRIAKGEKDEKHITPLQLDVIARAIDWWSSEGDTVFSPFAGIGSEGYEAVKMGRKFIGIELKEEYYKFAIKYLREADMIANRVDLFSLNGIEVDTTWQDNS